MTKFSVNYSPSSEKVELVTYRKDAAITVELSYLEVNKLIQQLQESLLTIQVGV